jgi:hypothetical protein
MYCICGLADSANHKKDWVRKSQIRKVLHCRRVQKDHKKIVKIFEIIVIKMSPLLCSMDGI